MILNKNDFIRMYEQMLTTRRFEEKVAEFLSQGMIHGTGHLYIGEIRIEISDKEGKPIPGYSFSDCSPIRGDELKYPVSWRGKTKISASKEEPVVVQFKMSQAKLFAVYLEIAR